ncbi:MAG TPA: TetR/AcrR family transcriptional regulator [Nocardioidaceae bacterium]|nr:TetR/AcrR family transcriptional regulator [Nocardioidaceae bacterium]
MDTEPRPRSSPARDRLIDTAYELFSTRGIRDVGIDELIDRAGVAKATLYRHFDGKDDLAAAFLAERERRWTVDLVQAGALSRGETPEDQLLAIFDVFDDWFHRADFDACAFITTLLEMRADHSLGRASITHLATIRGFVTQLAQQAGLSEPETLAHSWHLLMKGSIVAAAEGDHQAAGRAKAMARCLLAEHRMAGAAAADGP